MGWDKYREMVFECQKKLGITPDAELSRHDPDVKPWDKCSPDEKKVYARDDGGVRGVDTRTITTAGASHS